MGDSTLTFLIEKTSLSSIAAASCLSEIVALNQNQKYVDQFVKMIKSGGDASMKGALCLGEIGKKVDMSKIPNIIGTISALFKVDIEAIRTAASICLGNLSIGNPDYFLKEVFVLVDKS